MTEFMNIDISFGKMPIRNVRIPIVESLPREHANRLVGQPLAKWIEEAIRTTLFQTGGIAKKAYPILGMSERTFFRRCKEYHIDIWQIKKQIKLQNQLKEPENE